MARIDNLNNFLTDVATAIKDKTGKNDAITPANFDTEIASIKTGGGSSTITKGLVIDACNENGYVTEASIVGLSSIPNNYCLGMFPNTGYTNYPAVFNNDTIFHLPDDVTLIGDNAFKECKTLVLTRLPSKLTEIGQYAFYSCSKLALTELPSGLTSIGQYAFYYCSKSSLTKLPSGLTSIGANCFEGCINLTITEIPIGITIIPRGAFVDCTKLTHLTLKGSIASIGTSGYAESVFGGSKNLVRVSLPNVETVPYLNSYSFNNTPIKKGTGYVYVPDSLVDSFKTATNWSAIADQIKPISELEVE